MFSKFGKLARLDYLFHKTGALRGKPRGYAFVEYTGERVSARHIPLPPFPIYYDAQLGSFPPHGVRLHLCAGHAFLSLLDLLCSDSGLSPTPRRDCTDYSIDDSATDALVLALLQDAAVALEAANGKVLRGRHINVTYAHQAPPDTHAHHPALRRTLPQHQHQHQQQDSGRPTTLSLLKSAPSHTRTRCASLCQPAPFFVPLFCSDYAMRNRTGDKIAQMEAKLVQLAQASATADQPTVPAHPSLPAKPGTAQPTVKAAPSPSIKPPLPRVPEPSSPSLPTPAVLRAPPPRKSNALLKGVKIVRRKDRAKGEGTGGE